MAVVASAVVAVGTAAGVISAVAGGGGAGRRRSRHHRVADRGAAARSAQRDGDASLVGAPHPARSRTPAPPRVSHGAAVPSGGGLYRHPGCKGAAGTFSPDYAYRPATG
ncbi:hypothetical protein [Streptomyces sp. NPDC059814]|uniref:hypothetical protein n=1 Tax=Streptomyces sp. NPDC059814 TaxID=3346959 RepID=UPI00366529EB